MRRLLLLLPIALVAGALAWWFRGQPKTELVDASGAALTAGEPLPGTRVEPGTSAPEEDPERLAFAEARRLVDAGSFAAARVQLVDLLETSERDGEACVLLSCAARGLEEHDEAIDYGLKAVELVPESGPAWQAYSKALRDKLVKARNKFAVLPLVPRWREAVRRAIELVPEDVETRLEEIAFYLYLPGIAGGDVERAIELCDDLKQFDAPKGQLWRALAHKHEGELDQAQALCEDGLERYPEELHFAVTLGTIHADAERRQEADAAFERGKAAGPGEPYYRALMAQVKLRLEGDFDPQGGLALVDEYIAADPQYPAITPLSSAWGRKGRLLVLLGRDSEAREAFERCLRLDPDSKEAREGLEALPSESSE